MGYVTVSEVLINVFFLATLLNFLLTPRFAPSKIKKLQNKISLAFLAGLFLFYFNLGLEYYMQNRSIIDFLKALWIPSNKSFQTNFLYSLHWIAPPILICLNMFKRLRLSYPVIILNLLFFFPVILDFFVTLTISNTSIWNLNRLYTTPILIMLIGGTITYFLMYFIETTGRFTDTSLDEFVDKENE